MNPMHWHLMLNHFPFFGAVAGLVLAQYAVYRRSSELKRTSLLVFVATAVAAVPVALSGRGSGVMASRMRLVSPSLLEQHEDAAESALWSLAVLGALSAWALLRRRRHEDPGPRVMAAAAFLSLVCAALLGRAAYLGGQLRHPEIQPDWKDFSASSIPGAGP